MGRKPACLILAVIATLLGSLLPCVNGPSYAASSNISPNMAKWMDPLPIPPVAVPQSNPAYPGADYYEITETQHPHQFNAKLGFWRRYGHTAWQGTPVSIWARRS